MRHGEIQWITSITDTSQENHRKMNFGALVEAGQQDSPKNHHSRMIIRNQAAAIQTAKAL